ncbi:MAG: class II fructose-bisphosphate aldolase [Candidatus Marisimplicoccus sp.]|nr:MAG: Fructose-bisphosphate aldolase class 2 [Flavobacteriales bacterium]
MKNNFLYGTQNQQIYKLAKKKKFALPAINVSGTNTINSVLETASELNSPVIIQFSSGGSQFIAGKGMPNNGFNSSISGSIAGAYHIHKVIDEYNSKVVIHTDHCSKKLLPWIDGLLEYGKDFHKKNGYPLFSSHMIDLSEEPIEENISICKEYLKRMSDLDMTLEIELGVTGGEEDGVDNTDIDSSKLYTQPEEVAYAYSELISISDNFMIAAAFGNVHGVYKPGNVKLTPKILKNSQEYVSNKFNIPENSLDFVFHGGSGSSVNEIREAIDYGVIKMNIDTDLQFAFTEGIRDYMIEKKEYLMSQIGNPEGDENPNKKFYDPRAWLRQGEKTFKARLIKAFEDLNNINTLD